VGADGALEKMYDLKLHYIIKNKKHFVL